MCFAWFEPALVAALWDAARTAVAPGLLAQARDDRLEEVCDRLNHWGQLCIAAGAFPPDILKRAAG